jgi:hypothetical protein
MVCNRSCEVKIIEVTATDPDDRIIQQGPAPWSPVNGTAIALGSSDDKAKAEQAIKDKFADLMKSLNGQTPLAGSPCPSNECDCIVTRVESAQPRDWSPPWFELSSGTALYRVTWKMKRIVNKGYGVCDDKSEDVAEKKER